MIIELIIKVKDIPGSDYGNSGFQFYMFLCDSKCTKTNKTL